MKPATSPASKSRRSSKETNAAPTEVKKSRARKVAKRTQLNLFEPIAQPDKQVTYTAKAKQGKKFEDYKLTRPAEQKLFEFATADSKQYSNTIELYDFIPKYCWKGSRSKDGEHLDPIKRQFQCRGNEYKVTIIPARIESKDGKFKDYYPSIREELVEAALRKLACGGQGIFLDDQASVVFSLYELQQELKEMGHTYSLDEIKEALCICATTNIRMSTEDGNSVLISNIFETLSLRTWEDWKGQGQKTKCFVRFNPLVTSSIKNGAFRRLNYKKYMSYKRIIARQLYQRMSHHYTQASIMNTYDILLSTIIRDFGLTIYKKISNNLREAKEALDEMKGQEDILEYKVEKIIDQSNRNKLIDAKFVITPHPKFASEAIAANKKQAEIKKLQSSTS